MEFHWLPEWQLVCGGDDLVCLFFHSAEDKPAACIAKDGNFFWNNLRAQTSKSIFLSFGLSEEVSTEIVHRSHCLPVSLSVLCPFWHLNENRTQFICTKHSSIRIPRVLWPLSSDYWQREACWQNTSVWDWEVCSTVKALKKERKTTWPRVPYLVAHEVTRKGPATLPLLWGWRTFPHSS